MTKDQQMAVAAAAILYACADDNLRDLSANDRAIALGGRAKAWELLVASGVTPTELKDLGLELLRAAMGL